MSKQFQRYPSKEEYSLEEQADQFLADNDPYYRDRRAKKSRKEDYPYLTRPQLEVIRMREIPFSNLTKGQVGRCADKDCDLENYRDKGADD